MSAEVLYWGALSGAFWLVLRGAGREVAGAPEAARLVGGLVVGAGLARFGGLLLVPLGLLLAAPPGQAQRRRFLGATLPALPLAFAGAKLGCVAAGCCAAAGAEALAFFALACALRCAPARHAAPLALLGIGATRLAVLPFRPEALFSALPATFWLALGALRCLPTNPRGPGCPHPGSAISRPTAGSSKPGCVASSRRAATSP